MAYRVTLPRAKDEEPRGSEARAASPMLAGPVPPVPVVPQPDRVRAYRATLREWWRLMGLGPDVDRQTATVTYDKVIRLIDEVGEPLATRVRHKWEAEWTRETGRCPRCGERDHGREGDDTR